jgi:hypothetical protein
MLSFLLCYVYIFGAIFHGTEGNSTLNVKLAEELQILETGRMDIGANDVDADVKYVSDDKDDSKGDDAAGESA